MTDNSNYIPSINSQNKNSSEKIIKLKKKKNYKKKKKKSTKLHNNQEKENESTTQTSTPFEETIIQPSKSKSWVWNYFIKNFNEKGELCAYCQFIMENGEICTKSYKYTGSTGNLNGHAIRIRYEIPKLEIPKYNIPKSKSRKSESRKIIIPNLQYPEKQYPERHNPEHHKIING